MTKLSQVRILPLSILFLERKNDEFFLILKDNTKTFNDANAVKSTNSSLLGLYGVIGALRNREEIEIDNLFSKAFSENR